jgi:prevent-host-death family protein
MDAMKRMVATDAKTNFGQLVDTALVQPVAIARSGRDVAVVMSRSEYDRLKQIEAREQERSSLLEFVQGLASKSETMRELGMTSVYDLRAKMAEHHLALPRVPIAHAQAMASSVQALFPKKRARI